MAYHLDQETEDEASSSSPGLPDVQPGLSTISPHQNAQPWRSEATLSQDQQQPISAWDDYPQLPELAAIENQHGRLDPDYAKEVVFPVHVADGPAELSTTDQHADDVEGDIVPDRKYSISYNEKRKRRRICGLPLGVLVCLAVTVAVAVAIGLGVGLHYGLKKSR
jgi:hypothetical protein